MTPEILEEIRKSVPVLTEELQHLARASATETDPAEAMTFHGLLARLAEVAHDLQAMASINEVPADGHEPQEAGSFSAVEPTKVGASDANNVIEPTIQTNDPAKSGAHPNKRLPLAREATELSNEPEDTPSTTVETSEELVAVKGIIHSKWRIPADNPDYQVLKELLPKLSLKSPAELRLLRIIVAMDGPFAMKDIYDESRTYKAWAQSSRRLRVSLQQAGYGQYLQGDGHTRAKTFEWTGPRLKAVEHEDTTDTLQFVNPNTEISESSGAVAKAPGHSDVATSLEVGEHHDLMQVLEKEYGRVLEPEALRYILAIHRCTEKVLSPATLESFLTPEEFKGAKKKLRDLQRTLERNNMSYLVTLSPQMGTYKWTGPIIEGVTKTQDDKRSPLNIAPIAGYHRMPKKPSSEGFSDIDEKKPNSGLEKFGLQWAPDGKAIRNNNGIEAKIDGHAVTLLEYLIAKESTAVSYRELQDQLAPYVKDVKQRQGAFVKALTLITRMARLTGLPYHDYEIIDFTNNKVRRFVVGTVPVNEQRLREKFLRTHGKNGENSDPFLA